MATSQFSAFKEQLRLLFKTYSYLPTSENVVGDDTGLVHVLNEDGFKSVIYSINTRENLFSAFMGEESSENDELTMNNVLHQLGTDSVLRKLWHQMVLGQYPNWEKLTYEEKKRVAIPWNAFYQPFLSFLHESLHVYMHPDLLRGGASPRPREAPFTPRRQAMFNDAQPLTPNDNGKYFRTPRRNGPHPGNSPNTLREGSSISCWAPLAWLRFTIAIRSRTRGGRTRQRRTDSGHRRCRSKVSRYTLR
ncbi:hypothetical protein ADEAN_000520200 [Angomonas deanei]|uniref:Uncharacterized protein n=1 Tax=Angomonas deanei TaxID=59799 RepID=A0A7G2CHM8_9TRYP|nr:hypothetical protein ADEAN_000520200 [Angomonas deanei]